MQPVTTDTPGWRHPDDAPPPRATKLLLYTKTRILVLGHWRDEDCLLWMPLLRVPQELKLRLELEGK